MRRQVPCFRYRAHFGPWKGSRECPESIAPEGKIGARKTRRGLPPNSGRRWEETSVTPASQTPPPVREADFEAVNITDEVEIRRRFNLFIRRLHAYLNQLPCLRDVPQARRRWKPRAHGNEAFGNLAAGPRECYTYNCGGRNEAQFNVGLLSSHLRVGLGFEFTLKEGGDPTAVHLAYTCFASVIRVNRSQFEQLVANNQLEIEWTAVQGEPLQFVSTGNVVHWLLNLPQLPVWICIGRLLRRGQDTAVLEDPIALGKVMQEVLGGFRPLWEKAQVMAHTR